MLLLLLLLQKLDEEQEQERFKRTTENGKYLVSEYVLIIGVL